MVLETSTLPVLLFKDLKQKSCFVGTIVILWE